MPGHGDDLWAQPEARAWRTRANRELRPMIEGASVSLTLWPTDGEPDAKIAVELGFTLLLGKPLVILKRTGDKVPPHLERLAELVIDYDDYELGTPELADRIGSEVQRIAGERERPPAVATAEPSADDVRNLVCPYCGGKLQVNTQTTGQAYLSYEEPESIECVAPGCSADWEPDGTLRTIAGWLLHPTLYARPDPDGTP